MRMNTSNAFLWRILATKILLFVFFHNQRIMLNCVIFIRGVWMHVATCAFSRRAPQASLGARQTARSAVRHEHLAPRYTDTNHC